jgi:hypothetical protein
MKELYPVLIVIAVMILVLGSYPIAVLWISLVLMILQLIYSCIKRNK